MMPFYLIRRRLIAGAAAVALLAGAAAPALADKVAAERVL